MTKHVELTFHHWDLRYNGIVPTGNSDYSAEHEYHAWIYYEGELNGKELSSTDDKYFTSLKEALKWINEQVGENE